MISPEKDVDGFHPYNVGKIVRIGEELRQEGSPLDVFQLSNASCTPLACIELLDRGGVDIKGKRAVVIGRSNIVGLPLSTLLLHKDATVTTCHKYTPNLQEVNTYYVNDGNITLYIHDTTFAYLDLPGCGYYHRSLWAS